ncbi:MAG TPA: class I SAM-dependent DNA methyltransferase [Candidatus Saccharicenans sp.]|nr:class I SAM-dependent DNA methyltransferase [Candidatus Saccharicenans sp.]HQM74489.1 class I SAM-dependent DNA methyltransferase [Candidatus Saccharicenans sp.]
MSLDLSTLENWLWEAACIIRGPIDAPKFKDYILPLIFLKRLSDVFEDELESLGNQAKFVEGDHKLVRFYLPFEARWSEIARQTTNLGEYLTNAVRAVARENPKLSGVIDVKDFNETAAGQRILDDDRLRALIQRLSKYRLGLRDVEPDILGRAYEYLLRKFVEGQGQSAGEFYTPRELAVLIAHLIDPEPGDEIYDPCCGSGGLLIKAYLRFREKYGSDPRIKPLRFYGQEINPTTFAMARMNAFIHDMDAEIALGDTMNRPAFLTGDGTLRRFDKVAANPMWNQNFAPAVYEGDTYGRFIYGTPPASSADWGWAQHMFASLKENGKMAMVIDTGAVSRGSGNQGSNRERDIRKAFVENDFVEAVILLPENLFYNTTAPGNILLLSKRKAHPGEILLINASQRFAKGRPKNYLTDEDVAAIAGAYRQWQAVEGFAAVIRNEEAARNDYNLSPSRYVSSNNKEETLPLEEAVVLLEEAEEERAEADRALGEVLRQLGLRGL